MLAVSKKVDAAKKAIFRKREWASPWHWIRLDSGMFLHLLTRRTRSANPRHFIRSGGLLRFRGETKAGAFNARRPPIWTQFWHAKAAVSLYYQHRTGKVTQRLPSSVLIHSKRSSSLLSESRKRWSKLWDVVERTNYFFNYLTGEVTWSDPRAVDIDRLSVSVKPAAAVTLNEKEERGNEAFSTMHEVLESSSVAGNELSRRSPAGSSDSIGENLARANVVDHDSTEGKRTEGTESCDILADTLRNYNQLVEEKGDGDADVVLHHREGADEWIELWDEESGSPYYSNQSSGVSVWELPKGASVQWSAWNEALEDEAAQDWRELIDDESGCPYYVNECTGETQWELPQGAHVQWSVLSSSERENFGGGTTGAHWVTDKDASEASAWTEVFDEDSGSSYFFNSVSGEAKWYPPEEAVVTWSPMWDADEDTWSELWDEESECVYYVSDMSGDAAWELPEGAQISWSQWWGETAEVEHTPSVDWEASKRSNGETVL
eukprot:g3326.t1